MPFAMCRVMFYRNTSSPTFRYKWATHSKRFAQHPMWIYETRQIRPTHKRRKSKICHQTK